VLQYFLPSLSQGLTTFLPQSLQYCSTFEQELSFFHNTGDRTQGRTHAIVSILPLNYTPNPSFCISNELPGYGVVIRMMMMVVVTMMVVVVVIPLKEDSMY
jgi:hypothetical protein